MNLTPEGKDRLDAMKKALAEEQPLADLAKAKLERTLEVLKNGCWGYPVPQGKKQKEQPAPPPLPSEVPSVPSTLQEPPPAENSP